MDKVQIMRPKTRFDLWYVVRNMFSTKEIEQIETDIASIKPETASIIAGVAPDYRDSKVQWVPQYDQQNWKWMYQKIWKWAKIANDDNWGFDIQGFRDSPQYTTYGFPDGHYDWHTDLGGEDIDHRKISMSLVMQEGDKGGDLEFKVGTNNEVISLNEGDAVFFPSWYLHRVTRVLSGNRTSLVAWISGQPFK